MRRGIVLVVFGLFLSPAVGRAQFTEFTIDPRLGPLPTFGPGGYISNGNGYSTPNGTYWPGLYFPPNDLGNGPSPYYSPLYSALAAAPRMTREEWLYRVPGAPQSVDRAGWRVDPSLPDLHLFRKRRNR
ncbi:MAG TPA: hypothetical protein VFT74_09790 [Isosphaeraceae bacterium]|nr:hypothetical protein [Isosphaeraceae bacterium]